MATLTTFQAFSEALVKGEHNLHTDTLKVKLVTSAVVPAAADVAPEALDYTEVTPGGNYPAGGLDITNTVSRAGGTSTVNVVDIPIAVHASNPTNARYAVVYNDTLAGDPCIGFYDLGAVQDLTLGNYTLNFTSDQLLTVA